MARSTIRRGATATILNTATENNIEILGNYLGYDCFEVIGYRGSDAGGYRFSFTIPSSIVDNGDTGIATCIDASTVIRGLCRFNSTGLYISIGSGNYVKKVVARKY